MAHKFIIYNNEILMSSAVEFHRELLPKNYDKNLIKGGGRFNISWIVPKIYFYGKSDDFGITTKEDFEAAYNNTTFDNQIIDFVFLYSQKEYMSEVLKEPSLYILPPKTDIGIANKKDYLKNNK